LSDAEFEREAAQLKAMAEFDPRESPISVTPGFAGWLLDNRASLAFTSYQTGQLVLAGVGPDGRLSFNEQNYARATGLCYADERLYVGSMFQIWRLENMLKPGQFANNAFDCTLVPRSARTVNYVDIHELGVDRAGRLIFVNSRYSCLATVDERYSFRPIWKPPFITGLAAEDRCHLNGLAMADGAPKYVTAIAASDVREGWRGRRHEGGIVIEVDSGRIVTDRLSMPHSPRVHEDSLWALDSGRGYIVRIDEATGGLTNIAFCPGFLRGLAFHNGYAVVTVSKAREDNFRELALQEELERRGMAASCGILVVDLARGEIVQSILYQGKITEMFDVAVLPDIRNPMSIGPATVEMIGSVSVNESFAPLLPGA
jgi:uncharacterized protein (TIGR03032 family)